MNEDQQMATLALKYFGEATLHISGRDIAGYVAVHNWLEGLRNGDPADLPQAIEQGPEPKTKRNGAGKPAN